MLSSAKLNATGLHWIGELADFNFTIRYRPGKTNTDADTLSRMPGLMDEYMASCTEETCQDELYAIIQSAKEQDQRRVNWISSITHDPNVLSESESQPSTKGEPRLNETDKLNSTMGYYQGKVDHTTRLYFLESTTVQS